MLSAALQTWEYIKTHLVDKERGEWHWSDRNGAPNLDDDKAGFWKCPYHNSRMCLEVYERLG
jgi:mannobiose 2-epimerase